MSQAAQDLFELIRLSKGGSGALIEDLLWRTVVNIISPGIKDEREGG